jgi:hypothetical protein
MEVPMKLNRITLVVLVVLVAIVMSACGGEGDGKTDRYGNGCFMNDLPECQSESNTLDTVQQDVTEFLHSSDCAPNCAPTQDAPGGGLVTDPNNLPSQVWNAVINTPTP